MVLTMNGWTWIPSYNDVRLTTITVNGRSTKVAAGDAAVVLQETARLFHEEVEPISTMFGWRTGSTNDAYGGVSNSNHFSGTALDLNGGKHLRYKHNTFTSAQVAKINSIIARLGNVVRWGGDWNKDGRLTESNADEMHFEIVGTTAQVRAVADKIRAAQKPPAPPEEDIMATLTDVTNAVNAAVRPLLTKVDQTADTVRSLSSAVASLTAAASRTGRWVKFEGSNLAWLDLGVARRRGTVEQYAAAGKPPIGVLSITDPFWDLPIVGDAWGELYRLPLATDSSGASWLLEVQDGHAVRRWPSRQDWLDHGQPPIVDLPKTHGFWKIPAVNKPS